MKAIHSSALGESVTIAKKVTQRLDVRVQRALGANNGFSLKAEQRNNIIYWVYDCGR